MWTMRSKQWQWIGGALMVVAVFLRVLIRARVVDETTSWIILGVFVLLTVMNVPIGYALSIATILAILWTGAASLSVATATPEKASGAGPI